MALGLRSRGSLEQDRASYRAVVAALRRAEQHLHQCQNLAGGVQAR